MHTRIGHATTELRKDFEKLRSYVHKLQVPPMMLWGSCQGFQGLTSPLSSPMCHRPMTPGSR
jgi:hypothetical protein